MKKLTSQQIRETWLNFFKDKGHMIEPGASLIPHNDPTLLWINSGVAALKKYFDGSETPECKRITNVQKCIRTNDIDNVGRTSRHQTFFEMLGNFSIGDYFRKEVIAWAFEILTNEKYFGIPKDKIYVTYHPEDLETRDLWEKQGMDPNHIVPLEGNYWQIGEGPCGPNTEVFYDRGEKYDPEKIGDKLLREDLENDRYIEIWGIVFSQYNAVNGVDRKDYKELPHKNIDTGAGLERIACVLQGTNTNFETDLFKPIIEETEKLCGKRYEGELEMSFRVIADHIRACCFALADGESFSNEGRGYALRRLLRRAMRYGQKLGFFEPFLYKLVKVVIDVMKPFYSYLVEKQEYLEKMINAEEKKFIKTLQQGENIFYSLIDGKKELSGKDAFKLYDTYGFPIELTEEMCQDKGVGIDIDGFNACLEEQKELARNSRKVIESFNKQSKDLLEFFDKSEFIYDLDDINSKVIGLFKDGNKVDSIEDEGDVIFEKTPFYAEMGGQVSDNGIIKNENFEANVINVSKAPNKQHLHHIKVSYGTIKVGDELTLILNKERRMNIMRNHSATHLLQTALISILGDSIRQKGSYVDDNYLRFDFNYFEKVGQNELSRIEKEVNKFINMAIPQKTLVLPIEDAKKIGALAEFDQKYGDYVRVVTFGDVSKEFCGGTHVLNTQDIGIFKIISEESVSAGVRRIVATTSYKAYENFKMEEVNLNNVKEAFEVKNINEIFTKIKNQNELINKMNNEIEKYKALEIQSKLKSIDSLILSQDKLTIIISYFKDIDKKGLMNILDSIKSKTSNYLVVISGDENGKHPLIVASGKNIDPSLKANIVIKKVTNKFGGNGGGKPDIAQGSINDVSNFNLTLDELK